MFLSSNQINRSLNMLQRVHPFYVTTFLVCKRANLPVGRATDFSVNAEETNFLDQYFRPVQQSEYFYRVFRPSDKQKDWIHRRKYASSTLQSIRTQTVFAQAFIHSKNSHEWGWQNNYIEILKSNLDRNLGPYKNKPVPAFDLAVWLYREHDWPSSTRPFEIVNTFFHDFAIDHTEIDKLFDASPNAIKNLFQDHKVTWDELRETIKSSPPDIAPEEGGTLAYLELQGIGPAKRLSFDPAERLSLVAGDNGLGKTFLLECAWWALTAQWANPNLPAYPRQDAGKDDPKITFQISGETRKTERISISYDWDAPGINKWPVPPKRPTIPGLLIYARVDGSFAICDPVGRMQTLGEHQTRMPHAFVFTREQVWDGYDEIIQGQKRPRINGLIDDWVSWQNDPDKHTFEVFTKVLERLSPPSTSDLGTLRAGQPIRLPDDTRRIPTLEHPYGTVPIVHAAAGVKRILTLAYLLVWAWNEHLINSSVARKTPQSRMVILIDELEAHLHPQWQRQILPALLKVKDDLAGEFDLEVQSIVATHSPLVMASVEPFFNDSIDKLFHLDIVENTLFGNEVEVKELSFVPRGLVDSWLTSEVFGLGQARSLEAEQAILTARLLQLQESPARESIQAVTDDLQKYLSEIDTFWPRWTYFAEKHGVHM